VLYKSGKSSLNNSLFFSQPVPLLRIILGLVPWCICYDAMHYPHLDLALLIALPRVAAAKVSPQEKKNKRKRQSTRESDVKSSISASLGFFSVVNKSDTRKFVF
jgi:hypothetical protein